MTATEDRDPGDEHHAPAARLTPETAADLRMGDAVFHHRTGETWVLRSVHGDRLSWLGWPAGEAKVSGFSLVSRCSDSEHEEWTATINRPSNLLGKNPGDERAEGDSE